MSTGPQNNPPASSAEVTRLYHAVWAAIVLVMLVGILGFAFLAYELRKPDPAPVVVDPLPADVRALWLSTADSWDRTAADLDAGVIKEDPKQVSERIGEYRKPANDKLFSDFPAGRWSARLRDGAKVTRAIVGTK